VENSDLYFARCFDNGCGGCYDVIGFGEVLDLMMAVTDKR
jgi:hypothetical protein